MLVFRESRIKKYPTKNHPEKQIADNFHQQKNPENQRFPVALKKKQIRSTMFSRQKSIILA